MRNNAVAEPVLTLTYGAVDAYPAVMRALSRPILFDLDPAFLAQYEDVNEKARTALRLSNQPVILQGAPTLGVEAAAASLIAAEDTVLNLVNGVYSKGFSRWARRYCKNLVEVEISYDEAFGNPSRVGARPCSPSRAPQSSRNSPLPQRIDL